LFKCVATLQPFEAGEREGFGRIIEEQMQRENLDEK
jgi:hypothetical protein